MRARYRRSPPEKYDRIRQVTANILPLVIAIHAGPSRPWIPGKAVAADKVKAACPW